MGINMDLTPDGATALKPISVPVAPLVRGRSWKDHGRRRMLDHEIFSDTDEFRKKADAAIAQWIDDILHQHYYGHLWTVTVDSRPNVGMVYIRHNLTPQKAGIRIRLPDIDPNGRIVVRLAGELLERYNVPRAALDVDAMLIARQLTRGIRGLPG